jgi:hypothetical protein
MLATKDLITIVVSFSALLLSLLTLYLSQLRAARIQMVAGEHVNLGHYVEGNLNITLPITFINHGVRIAIVRRVALLVQSSASNEGYLLEPYFFQKINETGHFQHESQPIPIVIGGKHDLTKYILFRSSIEHPTEFQILNVGTYQLTLLGWTKNSATPRISSTFSLVITPAIAEEIQGYLTRRSVITVRVPQEGWQDWKAQSLSKSKIKGLRK